jgi:hypothetical protein
LKFERNQKQIGLLQLLPVTIFDIALEFTEAIVNWLNISGFMVTYWQQPVAVYGFVCCG